MSNITNNEKINSSSWHLDKRIPITLVVMILMQTGAGFWWASKIDSRMTEIEKDSTTHISTKSCNEKLRTLETKVHHVEALNNKVAERLKDIDNKLDRLIESTFFNIRSNGN